MSSLKPSKRGSFRVATTVPTTRARIMKPLAPATCRRSALRPADRQHVFQALVRARDDMHRDEFAHASRRGGAGIGGRANRRHVAAHHRGHVARSDFFPADQVYLGGFTMASAASIMATKPRVSIIPNASPIYALPKYCQAKPRALSASSTRAMSSARVT